MRGRVEANGSYGKRITRAMKPSVYRVTTAIINGVILPAGRRCWIWVVMLNPFSRAEPYFSFQSFTFDLVGWLVLPGSKWP